MENLNPDFDFPIPWLVQEEEQVIHKENEFGFVSIFWMKIWIYGYGVTRLFTGH